MKRNIINIFILMIGIFFINMGVVEANCDAGTLVPICTYSYDNQSSTSTDYIRINACMENSEVSYFRLTVEEGQKDGTLKTERTIQFYANIPEKGTIHVEGNNQAYDASNSSIKDLYVSRYAMSDLIKATKNINKEGKSSTYCPTKLTSNYNEKKIAIAKSDDYIKWVTDEKEKFIRKAHTYNLENVATVGMSDGRKKGIVDGNEDLGLDYNIIDGGTNGGVTISEASCETLLGSVDNPDEPAYYLDFGFTIIKYLAIIILVLFSMKDFALAVISKDDEAVKKATSSSLKRFIYCVIIFVAPILVKLVLNWAHIVSTNPLCGIGGV